jgi:hypothetical protein
MARNAEALEACGIEAEPKIASFKFMILDDTFTNPKSKKKEPVQFIFEDHHVELQHGVTYDASRLPEGLEIDALVNHLNSRPGYPVFEMVPFTDPFTGKVDPKQLISEQTGWEPRFECVNMRYA